MPHCTNRIAISATLLAACLWSSACTTQSPQIYAETVTLSIVATNDVHGQLLPAVERGGLGTLSGYVNALRNVREKDAVVLIDAGDMWQGTLESNLSEGAAVVQAYNALGYAAVAVGNHEFDFGPTGEKAIPASSSDDARGALKQRATEANFPLLAANLYAQQSGEVVDWPNVVPSTLLDAAGIRVGIIGVMTSQALSTTIAANTQGLVVMPLVDTIEREARTLRSKGADIVIVTAHAGGRCRNFTTATDTSSCDLSGEIFRVAKALPVGSVDQIIAGHVHDGIAHIVNGIAITANFSRTYAFGRVDYTIDKKRKRVLAREIMPPQVLCPYRSNINDACVWENGIANTRIARYEGHPIQPDPAVASIVDEAQQRALALKTRPLGTTILSPFTLKGNPESALANLMTDALLATSGADIAIHNVSGGIRASLPAGELQFGHVYEAFPFDNRLVRLQLDGQQLRDVIAAQLRDMSRRIGFSGMNVVARCDNNRLTLNMYRTDGSKIANNDTLVVAVNDYLATGGDDILAPAMPASGFKPDPAAPQIRDLLVAWLSNRKPLRAEDFLTSSAPKWQLLTPIDEACRLSHNP